jgi:hypothetical protein
MHLKKLKNQSASDDVEEESKPLQLQTQLHLQQEQQQQEFNNNNNNNSNRNGGEKTFNFIVMVKKGNKPQFHNLEVPVTSEFATQFRVREQVFSGFLIFSWFKSFFFF